MSGRPCLWPCTAGRTFSSCSKDWKVQAAPKYLSGFSFRTQQDYKQRRHCCFKSVSQEIWNLLLWLFCQHSSTSSRSQIRKQVYGIFGKGFWILEPASLWKYLFPTWEEDEGDVARVAPEPVEEVPDLLCPVWQSLSSAEIISFFWWWWQGGLAEKQSKIR